MTGTAAMLVLKLVPPAAPGQAMTQAEQAISSAPNIPVGFAPKSPYARPNFTANDMMIANTTKYRDHLNTQGVVRR